MVYHRIHVNDVHEGLVIDADDTGIFEDEVFLTMNLESCEHQYTKDTTPEYLDLECLRVFDGVIQVEVYERIENCPD